MPSYHAAAPRQYDFAAPAIHTLKRCLILPGRHAAFVVPTAARASFSPAAPPPSIRATYTSWAQAREEDFADDASSTPRSCQVGPPAGRLASSCRLGNAVPLARRPGTPLAVGQRHRMPTPCSPAPPADAASPAPPPGLAKAEFSRLASLPP